MIFVRPNWQDAAAYPKPDVTSNSRWAWEFLRRNPRYCDSWNEYVRAIRKVAGKNSDKRLAVEWMIDPTQEVLKKAGGNLKLQSLLINFDEKEELWCYTPRRMEGESRGEYVARMAQQGVTQWSGEPLARRLGGQFGLDRISNPAWAFDGRNVDFRERKGLRRPGSVALADRERKQRIDEKFEANKLVIEVDLSWPVDVIERVVFWWIRNERKVGIKAGLFTGISKRPRHSQWPIYLRVLDALAAGASKQRIGEALYPNKSDDYPERLRSKTVANAIKEANKMMEEGYRLLPLLAEHPQLTRASKKK